MAKGQRRSNREAKKPKQPKSEKSSAAPALTIASGPIARDSAIGGRDRTGGRNGRR
jgi:hypothetical protein